MSAHPLPVTVGVIEALAARVDSALASDNALDVLVEIALFEPDFDYSAVRANAAGSKLIYTHRGGGEITHWADDWTVNRAIRRQTAAALRAIAHLQSQASS